MTADEWQSTITAQMRDKGLDSMCDSPVVRDTAMLAAEADRLWHDYQASGGPPVVKHPHVKGATTLERTPLLQAWLAVQAQTLANYRELCLTPKSYRQAVGEVRQDPSAEFMKLLSGIESGGTAKCGTTRE